MREKAQVRFSAEFRRSYGRLRAAGRVTAEDFHYTLEYFFEDAALPAEWRDHPLQRNWEGYREFHFLGEADLVVVYRQRQQQIVFVDMGGHADFFRHRKWKRKGVKRPEPVPKDIAEQTHTNAETMTARAARLLKRLWQRQNR